MKVSTAFAVALGCVLCASSGCSDEGPTALSEPEPAPSGSIRLVAVTPTNLLGTSGAEVQPPPGVRVLDAKGDPVSGAQVTFDVTTGSGRVTGGSVNSDATGTARAAAWILGSEVGLHVVQARLSGISANLVEFTAMGRAPCAPPCAAGRRLAFVREGDIYAVNEDGSNLLRLTSTGDAGDPAWSPDGRQIAFVRGSQALSSSVHLMNADGSGLRFFANGGSPAWAPDGQRIAFLAPTLKISIYPVEPDGTQATQVGFDRGYQDSPAWSPDGSKIAFVSDWTAFDFALELYVANADGSGIVQVTDGFFGSLPSWPTYTVYAQPAWSPDGRSFAVVACQEWQFTRCEKSSIGILDADGSGFRRLTQTTGFARPTWSSDGTMVAFARTCWEHKCASSIFQVAANGAGEQLLIANGHSPAWRR